MSTNTLFNKSLSIGIVFAFLINVFGPFPAKASDSFVLPKPGVRVHLSPEFNPPILRGMKVHTDNPFKFDFILDKGDSNQNNDQLKQESNKLIKYFLASLTIPEKDLWVNLSPYEKDRIIPNSFGLTEMGRDLLAEDYMLKQITASLIYPEDEVGKKFWKRIYEEAAKKYGTTNIPVNTFNKVWIVPEKAVVYENAKAGTAYVVESKLKVMLEEDYLSLEKHTVEAGSPGPDTKGGETPPLEKNVNQIGSQIIREIVIPELTKEINENKNFAQLRQVYNSLILATWYKKKIKDSILGQVYSDKNKTAGINISDPQEKEKIYEQYLKAFKKGVYNYIKEEPDPVTHESIPRKYFSGGFGMNTISQAMTTMKERPQRFLTLGRGLLFVTAAVAAVATAVIQVNQPVAKQDGITQEIQDRAMTPEQETRFLTGMVAYLGKLASLVTTPGSTEGLTLNPIVPTIMQTPEIADGTFFARNLKPVPNKDKNWCQLIDLVTSRHVVVEIHDDDLVLYILSGNGKYNAVRYLGNLRRSYYPVLENLYQAMLRRKSSSLVRLLPDQDRTLPPTNQAMMVKQAVLAGLISLSTITAPTLGQSKEISQIYLHDQQARQNPDDGIKRVATVEEAQNQLKESFSKMMDALIKKYGGIIPQALKSPRLEEIVGDAKTFDDIAKKITEANLTADEQRQVMRWVFLLLANVERYDDGGVNRNENDLSDLYKAFVRNPKYKEDVQSWICESATVIAAMFFHDLGFKEFWKVEIYKNFVGKEMRPEGHTALVIKLNDGSFSIFDFTQGEKGKLNINVAHQQITVVKDGKEITFDVNDENLKKYIGLGETFEDVSERFRVLLEQKKVYDRQEQVAKLVKEKKISEAISMVEEGIKTIQTLKGSKVYVNDKIIKGNLDGLEDIFRKNLEGLTGVVKVTQKTDLIGQEFKFFDEIQKEYQEANNKDTYTKLKAKIEEHLKGFDQLPVSKVRPEESSYTEAGTGVKIGGEWFRVHLKKILDEVEEQLKQLSVAIPVDNGTRVAALPDSTAKKGGIDFTIDRTPLEIQNSGENIRFDMNPQQLRELEFAPGFEPAIIKMTPLQSIEEFLGP